VVPTAKRVASIPSGVVAPDMAAAGHSTIGLAGRMFAGGGAARVARTLILRRPKNHPQLRPAHVPVSYPTLGHCFSRQMCKRFFLS
jgi:hypothetical protein